VSLTTEAVQSAQSRTTDEAWLWLMTVSHDDLDAPFYLVNNTEPVTSNYQEYQKYPFEIVLSDDDGESLPKVKLKIDNIGDVEIDGEIVERPIIAAIRSLSDSPEINLKLVMSGYPDDVQYEITDLVLREVDYDAFSITGTLYADDILNSRFPADTISLAGGYLGLFR